MNHYVATGPYIGRLQRSAATRDLDGPGGDSPTTLSTTTYAYDAVATHEYTTLAMV